MYRARAVKTMRQLTCTERPYKANRFGARMSYTIVRTVTTPNIADLIKPLEETIRKVFLPNLTGQNDMERDMLALPTRLGGLGILDPCRTSALKTV